MADAALHPALEAPVTTPDAVRERLLNRGWEFDFFQAVWLLERMTPDAVRIGQRGPATDEPLCFRPDVSVGFPPTDLRYVETFRDSQGRERHQLEATFLGLYGVSTPLPLHFAIDMLRSVDPHTSETAVPEEPRRLSPLDEEVEERNPQRDFLDLFHHRLISLFYRAWTKYRYHANFVLSGRDVITSYLRWFIGLAPETTAAQIGLDPVRMIRYAGTLTQHPRSATTLEGVLSDYWDGLDVQVEQYVGRWVSLSTADMNRIGMANSRLGVDLTVGEQVYDLSGAFNVALGPVDWETYLAFLPDGAFHAQTRSLIRLYCADPLMFNFEIRLKEKQIPEFRLGSGDDASRLGYTGWLRTDEMPETSVVFDESSARSQANMVEG